MKTKTIINFLLFAITDLCVNIIKTHDKRNTVLLIRLDGIGDFILWLDAAQEFRKLYPSGQRRIILLANRTWADLAKLIPYWDNVWSLDRRKFLRNPVYRFRMLRKVREAGFEIAVQPTFSREFFIGDAIIRATDAKEKIGSIGDHSNIIPYQKRISDRWYTRLVPATTSPLMELKRNAGFIRGLGLGHFKAGLPILLLKNVDFPPVPEDFYVLFPGANREGKMWPIENFAHLASKIHKQTGWLGVVCGSPDEKKIGQKLKGICRSPLTNLVGRTTLRQLAGLIKKSQFLVGNDTSAVHMAAALATPCVGILGGGHFGRFMPYDLEVNTSHPLPRAVTHQMNCFGCNWRCIHEKPGRGPELCITRISVEQVWCEVMEILTE